MFISLFSQFEPLVPGWEEALPKKELTFYFTTRLDLTKRSTTRPTTLQNLLDYIFADLQFNPPHYLRGTIYWIQVFQILYWTQPKGPLSGYYYKIDIPNKTPIHELPPLAKLDGTYRVLFFSTHIDVGDPGNFYTTWYPKSSRARIRHWDKKQARKHLRIAQ